MKSVILAAGQGKRLGEATDQYPKCLLEIEGETLLERMISALHRKNVTPITIVCGYSKDMIMQEVAGKFPGVGIQFVINEQFHRGNALSVWLAREKIDGEFVLMDADVLFHEIILDRLVSSFHQNCFLLDRDFETGDEPVKVAVKNGRVIDFARRIQKHYDFMGESVGFFRFSAQAAKTFKHHISEYIQRGDLDADYEPALQSMLSEEHFGYEDITGLPWIEIDFPEDIEKAREEIYPAISGLQLAHRRHERKPVGQKKFILLNPGPGNITETVRQALITPDICHREQEFFQVMQQVRKKLVQIVGGEKTHTAVVFTGSGTSAVEATVSSVVPSNGKLLIINNGVYGDRLLQIAKAHGLDYDCLSYEWTQPPEIRDIEDILKNDRKITHLAIVHHETTTGLLNPIREIGALTSGYDVSLIVDGMSSFIAEPISVDQDKIDFVISSSNKAIQGIAGLAFVIARRSELQKLEGYRPRSVYLDLYNQWVHQENHDTPFTPAIQVFFALNRALDELIEEGLENRQKRYRENAQLVRKGMEDLGFRILIPTAYRSNCLTTFLMPDGFSYEIFHDRLKEKGFIIYAGQGSLKQNAFRIANLGDLTSKDISNFLKSCKEVLIQIGCYPVKYS